MPAFKTISAIAATIALVSASPVFALAVSIGGFGGVQVQTNAAANPNVDAGVSGSDATGVGGSINNASSNTAASANASLYIPLVVTRSNVSVNSAAVTAGSVVTKNDLSAYVASQMAADANLISVNAAPDHVAVTYAEPVTLLGCIPINIDATVTVDSSGTISIAYPWWAFGASSNQTQLQTRLHSSVNAAIGGAQAGAPLTAQQEAQLVAAIEGALAAGRDAHAGGSTSGSATNQ